MSRASGKVLIIFFFLFSTNLVANAQSGRKEIAAPIHPWTKPLKNYYLQYENYIHPGRSWLTTLGYKGDEILYLWFENAGYSGLRADYGQRLYLHTPLKWVQFFGGANLNLEVGKLSLEPYGLNIPRDSLEMKGVMVGPEINLGGKVTLFRRVSVTGVAGYRYHFNSFKTEQITFDPRFWRYNDWNNTSQNWMANRAFVEHFKRGGYPVIQINVAYVIGLPSR